MKFSLAISHAPWAPGRKESYARLLAGLQISGPILPQAVEWFKCIQDQAPNHVWSAEMWGWAADLPDVTHCVFLQDDAVPAPDFWGLLSKMIRARPAEEVICLESAHPAASLLYSLGERGYTTADGLIGVGYVVRQDILRRFLAWRGDLPQDAIEHITEDSLLGLWCAGEEIPIWSPLPTIIDHDVTIPSSYANDGHTNRRPAVRWSNAKIRPEDWAKTSRHMGRMYESTPALLRKLGGSSEIVSKVSRDSGRQEARRLIYLARARDLVAAEHAPRIFVAIPTTGEITEQTASSVSGLLFDEQCDVTLSYDIVETWRETRDVVRTRSRLMYSAFELFDADYIFFVDADVQIHPGTLRGMLKAQKDFVFAPYPRRDMLDFAKVKEQMPMLPPEAAAYRYSIQPLEDDLRLEKLDPATNCVAMKRGPLGCALISRKLYETLREKYCSELEVVDEKLQMPVVQLFMLAICKNERGERNLLSEDYSFCDRAREAGFSVDMYLGQGSPVNHCGMWTFRGMIESFNIRRGPA
jgi:hypothetical protein